jgi:hypothetical protein
VVLLRARLWSRLVHYHHCWYCYQCNIHASCRGRQWRQLQYHWTSACHNHFTLWSSPSHRSSQQQSSVKDRSSVFFAAVSTGLLVILVCEARLLFVCWDIKTTLTQFLMMIE